MKSVFRFAVHRWAVWAPELHSLGDWLGWSQAPYRFTKDSAPSLKALDPMLRRRCSKLSRMSLDAAGRALGSTAPDSVSSVFGSRNGECQTSIALLRMLANREMLSPMKFGLSVHNTASGLFTIAHHSRTASTAVAAGSQTFVSSLLEALAALARKPERPMLLVVSEELLPEEFRTWENAAETPYALAMLLGRHDGEAGGGLLRLSLEPSADKPAEDELPQGLRFVEWLFSPDSDLEFRGRSLRWSLRCESDTDWLSLLQIEQGAEV